MTGVKTNERPGTRAVLRHSRVSAYKAREVLDLIRGEDYERATELLEHCDRGVAVVIGKLLNSAAANARHNDGLNPEEMYVSACFADEGTTLKRWRPRARGRATRIRKRTCHITVILSRLPEDQLARRRARVAAEQSQRRARRVAGGLRRSRVSASAGKAAGAETETTTEALAALEEARALETTSHHEELEAEAQSALDQEGHEEHGHDEVAGAVDEGKDEAGDDETDEGPTGDVGDDEAGVSPPESSDDDADADPAGEEN